MKNFFGQVNETKIKEALYEMEVHLMRNTGAGGVSFKIYQYIIGGLQSENSRLAHELDEAERMMSDKNKEIESLKASLKTM